MWFPSNKKNDLCPLLPPAPPQYGIKCSNWNKKVDNYYYFVFLIAMDPFYNQAPKLWELIT
jgi:hypothetical protein